jgi:hypothetical protein
VKRLHAGSASRSGLEAAQLAKFGLTGPPTIFEGHREIFRLFGGSESADIPDALWERWHVLDTIFRFYPAVGTVHAPLDDIRHLRDERDVKAADEKIRVGLVDFALGHAPRSPGPPMRSPLSSASRSASACSSSRAGIPRPTTSTRPAGPTRRSSRSATWWSRTRCRSPKVTRCSAPRLTSSCTTAAR